jgi:hypothetical protein
MKENKMKVSKEATYWYEKVNTVWEENGFPIRFSSNNKNEEVDFKTAVKAIKGFWKKEMKTKFPYDVRESSGNRYTWVRYGDLVINTESGWANIIHLFGHWIGHQKKFPRPHCIEHALLEWRFTNYIFDGDYVEKSRKALSIAPLINDAKKDKVQMRYEAMLVREKRWSSKLTKAKNGHEKVLKEIKRYQSRHKGRLVKQ